MWIGEDALAQSVEISTVDSGAKGASRVNDKEEGVRGGGKNVGRRAAVRDPARRSYARYGNGPVGFGIFSVGQTLRHDRV